MSIAAQAPVLSFAPKLEEESMPWFIGAAAGALGITAGYVAWVCSECQHMHCNSFMNTVRAVKAWWGSGC